MRVLILIALLVYGWVEGLKFWVDIIGVNLDFAILLYFALTVWIIYIIVRILND
jgi:hypothetical protein